jgi:FkbM family methyltransferase
MNTHKIDFFGKTILMPERGRNWIDETNLIQLTINVIQTIKLNNNLNDIVYFDIGANQGNFSLIPTIDSSINCYSFEPNPAMFGILKDAIELNGLENNVTPFNIGLSNEITKLKLKVPLDDNDHGLATFAENPSERFSYDEKTGDYKTVTVECKTIDYVFKELNLDRLDYIKIDTEGSELNILKGGEETIKKYKPIMLFEFQDINANMFGYSRDELLILLKSWGYNAFHYAAGTDSNIIASEFEIEII